MTEQQAVLFMVLGFAGIFFAIGAIAVLIFAPELNELRYQDLKEKRESDMARIQGEILLEQEAWKTILDDEQVKREQALAAQRGKYELIIADERIRCDRDRDETVAIMDDLRANVGVMQRQTRALDDQLLELDD